MLSGLCLPSKRVSALRKNRNKEVILTKCIGKRCEVKPGETVRMVWSPRPVRSFKVRLTCTSLQQADGHNVTSIWQKKTKHVIITRHVTPNMGKLSLHVCVFANIMEVTTCMLRMNEYHPSFCSVINRERSYSNQTMNAYPITLHPPSNSPCK